MIRCFKKPFYISTVACFITAITAMAQSPVADFNSNITSGCYPITVNFTDMSSNSPDAWQWDFGNSNSSVLQNPSAVYSAPGNYTVTLIACNVNGCDTMIKNNYITVYDYPVAGFSSDFTYGCAPLTVQFSDTSIPLSSPIVSWFWDFGDGNFSPVQNPVNTFSLPGIYDVSISVTDSLGCNNSKSIAGYIIVSTPPAVSFTIDSPSACVPPLTANFTNTTTQGTYPVASWLWDLDDGFTDTGFNTQHTYNNIGLYTISLTATDSIGCSVTLTDTNAVVVGTDTADFTFTTFRTCSELQVSFSESSTGIMSNWSWDFGDGSPPQAGQNVAHNYTSSGLFTVTLIATNTAGCKDTVSKSLSYLKVKAGFFADSTYSCLLPFTVSFTDTSTGTPPMSWAWDFSYEPSGGFNFESGSQNPSYTYWTADTFDVMLITTDAFGCKDSITLKAMGDSIWVFDLNANIGASPSQGCAPLDVSFYDNSSSPMSPVISWQWDFDDPASGVDNFSSLQNPSHTFNSVGVFTVKLVVTNTMGCVDSTLRDIRTGYPPVADSITKTKSIACHGEPVTFTAFSSDANINGGQWEWGDGYFGNGWPSATHSFQDTGTLFITFWPEYNGCRGDSLNDTILILPPKPMFTPNTNFICRTPASVTFTNTSWEADTWSWNFGDGTPPETVIYSPTHTYTSPGRFTVTLTVSNSSTGCTDSRNYSYINIPEPTANFTTATTNGCIPFDVSFTNTSFTYIPVSYPITGWWWDFGDGNFSSVRNPTHIYTTAGSFTVTLVVTDISGCKDTLIRTNYINTSSTTAGFTATPVLGCLPFTVNFTDQSTPYSPIISRSWNFGDGSPANTSQNPSHLYTASGNFNVSLTITDSIGCTTTITKPGFITSSKPAPQFSHAPRACVNQFYIFTNNTPGSGLTYLWDFGDATTSSFPSPLHSYADTGIYTITLTATDTNGCSDSTTSQIEIIPLPVADFAVDSFFSLCPPLIVQFNDLSTNINDSIISWLWDFGDNTFSSSANPVHTFVYAGKFSIKLTVTNSTGCVDTLLVPDMITVDGPTGNFFFSPDTGCAPLTVSFTSSTNNVSQFTWDFADGVVDSVAGASAVHTYSLVGFLTPQLSLTDTQGCKAPAVPPDPPYLVIDKVIADFSIFPSPLYTPFCPPDTVFFSDSSITLNDSSLITAWLWDFGDGSPVDTAQNPIHVYTGPGAYTVTLTASSSMGCSDIITKTIDVLLNDTLVLKAEITDSVPVTCYGLNNGEATATGLSGTPPYTFLWDSSAGFQTTILATGLIPGIHWVTVTDSMGCTDSTSVMITEPDTLIAFTDSVTVVSCPGLSDGSITASATGGITPYSYQWDAAAGNQTTPQAINLMAGIYTVTITDSNGCVSTLTDTVPVPDTLMLSVIDTIHVACYGDSSGSAIVSSTGGTPPYSYIWNPPFPGNNDTALNLYAQNYTVTVVDDKGCDTSAGFTITEPPQLTVSTTKTDLSCDSGSDGSATANPSGGTPPYSYLWNTFPAQTTQIADSLTAGTWTVTVTDSNSCIITDSVTLISPPPLTMTLNKTDVMCYGGNDGSASLTAGGGTPPYTYLWNDPSATATATATDLQAGTWTVTLTDSNNCVRADSIFVPQPDSIVISFNKVDVSCYGGDDGTATANPAGGIPPYTYLWNDPSATTTATATNLQAGTWTVTVTDSNNCVRADSIFVPQPDSIVVSFNKVDVSCNGGDDGTATANPAGGIPPYTYLWNNPSAASTATATNLQAGTWTVTVTDTNGCSISDSVLINEPILLIANIIEISSALCNGESNGELQAQSAGGTPPYSYLWLPVNSTAWSIDSLPAGDYILTVSDSQNCQASDTVTITELTPLNISLDDNGIDTVCYNVGNILDAQPSGSAPPYTFLWTNGTITKTGNPVTVTPDTTETWSVTVTDSAGCKNSDSVTLYVNYLTVSLSNQDTVCYGTPANIEAMASGTLSGFISNYTYLWNTAQTTSSIQPAITSISTFIVIVTDGCSKPVTDTATLYLYTTPEAVIKFGPNPVCPFVEITFSDTINDIADSQYLWDFGDGNTSPGVVVNHAYSSGGFYLPTLMITTPNGCTKTVLPSELVVIYSTPVADFNANPFTAMSDNPVIYFTDMSWVNSISQDKITGYFWDFGDGDTTGEINPVHTYQDVGSFPVTLTVTTNYGCEGEITKTIRIDPLINILIPNAFTPNPYSSSGGSYDPASFDNDVFYPLTEFVEEYVLQIYNRWGELIFQSTDLYAGWDGYYMGKLSQQDTYVWKLKLKWITGEEYKKVGRVLLIR